MVVKQTTKYHRETSGSSYGSLAAAHCPTIGTSLAVTTSVGGAVSAPLGQVPPASLLGAVPLFSAANLTVPPPSLAANASTTLAGTCMSAAPLLTTGSVDTQPVVVGPSIPPIPRKLAESIWKGQFVAIKDLLPAALAKENVAHEEKKDKKRAKRRPEVRDIASWVLGFSAYVGVIALKQPERVPDLMAYMAQIVQASRQFQGSPWAEYDTRFRMQAAAQRRTRLAELDTTLWTVAFARAEPAQRCRWCLSVDHPSKECEEKSDEEEAESSPRKRYKASQETKKPICKNWNKGVCRSSWCSFRHICIECHGAHTKQDCPQLKTKTSEGRGGQSSKTNQQRAGWFR